MTLTAASHPTAPSRGNKRGAFALIAALALLTIAVLLSIMIGGKPTGIDEVWATLTGAANPYLSTVIEGRQVRTVVGVLTGIGLAVAGTLMQGITRNPLAEPGLLGINMGAAAAMVTATAAWGAQTAGSSVGWALPGAILAALIVYVIGATGSGGMVRLVLAGAVVTAVLTAYIQALTLSMPQVFDSYRYWVVGSLAGASLETVLPIVPIILLGTLLAVLLAPALNAMALGDEAATTIGANATLVRTSGLAAAVLLSASATAAVGPIAFVGLAVPHIVRAFVGVDFRMQVPFALLFGPAFLLLADVVGRVLVYPQELMVGVVSAFVGTPVLLYAVRRMRGTE